MEQEPTVGQSAESAPSRAEPSGERMPGSAWVTGGLSFIPMLGVVAAIAGVVVGASYWRRGGRALVVVSLAGAGVSFALYGFLFSKIQDPATFEAMHREMAQQALNQLPPLIEFHRLQTGEYPTHLGALDAGLLGRYSIVLGAVSDPSFSYVRSADGTSYLLRHTGPDKRLNTPDDLYPQIHRPEGSKIGLRLPAEHSLAPPPAPGRDRASPDAPRQRRIYRQLDPSGP